MRNKWLAACLLVCALSAQNRQIALPGYHFEFPRDHFGHPGYQTEWWYYTGNLRGVDGHRYGFELTFFRQANQLASAAAQSEKGVWKPDQLYLAHLALSDIDGQSFYHTERLNRAGPGLAGAAEADRGYWNGNWQVRWTALPSAQQELIAVCDRFTLRLQLQATKPPVIQGQDGVSRKGPLPGQASHYISFTRLSATGQLTQQGSTVRVTGLAWMDHEFFTEPADSDLAGWDWFAIELNNNEELMLYRLRTRSGAADLYSSGSYVDARGHVRFLSSRDFALTAGGTWESPHSRARYPVQWQISVPQLQLHLAAHTDLKDQELWQKEGRSPSYWEGAMKYEGRIADRPVEGVGYLEMTGYGEAIQLSGMTAK